MEGLEGSFFAISKIDVGSQNLGRTSRLDRERCIYVNTEGIASSFAPFSIRVLVENFDSKKERLATVFGNKDRLHKID